MRGSNRGMKAVLNQIPVEEVVEKAGLTTTPGGVGSNLWGQLRRLKAQIGQMELVISIIKRDVARIDRKQLRDAEKEQPSENPQANTQFPDGLFS